MSHLSLVSIYVALLMNVGFSQGPRPEPPAAKETVASLAHAVEQKLIPWINSGDVGEILNRPPNEARTALQNAAGRMREYKEAEINLYSRILQDLDDNIRLLQNPGVEWAQAFRRHADELDGDLELLNKQKRDLSRKAVAYEASTSQEAKGFAVQLRGQIDQIDRLQSKLTDQRYTYLQALHDESSPDGKDSALLNLQNQRTEIVKLKNLANSSRTPLENFYKHLLDSLPQAFTPLPRTPVNSSPPQSQKAPLLKSDGRTGSQNAAKSVDSNGRSESSFVYTWGNQSGSSGSVGTVVGLKFSATPPRGDQLQASLRILFGAEDQFTAFELECSIYSFTKNIQCSANDRKDELRGVTLSAYSGAFPQTLKINASGVHRGKPWNIDQFITVKK